MDTNESETNRPVSTTTTTSTLPPTWRSGVWLDIFLPISLIGIALLIIVLCHSYIMKGFRKCKEKCRNCRRSRETRDSVDCSISSSDDQSRCSHRYSNSTPVVNDFRVLTVSGSANLSFAHSSSAISDKLPTYEEFMSDKRKKNDSEASTKKSDLKVSSKKDQGSLNSSRSGYQDTIKSEVDLQTDELKEEQRCQSHNSFPPPPAYSAAP